MVPGVRRGCYITVRKLSVVKVPVGSYHSYENPSEAEGEGEGEGGGGVAVS